MLLLVPLLCTALLVAGNRRTTMMGNKSRPYFPHLDKSYSIQLQLCTEESSPIYAVHFQATNWSGHTEASVEELTLSTHQWGKKAQQRVGIAESCKLIEGKLSWSAAFFKFHLETQPSTTVRTHCHWELPRHIRKKLTACCREGVL